MIRKLEINDLEEANVLLSNFNYQLKEDDLNKVFFNSLVSVDDKINGIIVYNSLYDRIEIEYIIVDNEYRKTGIGTMLLKEIEKNNVKNITLEVRESNKSAIEFYKKNGYLMLKELGE